MIFIDPAPDNYSFLGKLIKITVQIIVEKKNLRRKSGHVCRKHLSEKKKGVLSKPSLRLNLRQMTLSI